MAISRVYIEHFLDNNLLKSDIINSIIDLDSSSYHHMVRVCRHKVGDNIILFDSSENDEQFLVEIVSADKKKFQVKILEWQKTNTKSSLHISLFPALARGNKFDVILQKSVELGVGDITPVITKYTQASFNLKDSDKLNSKLEHWCKVIISAAEQSGLNIIPKINTPVLFDDIISCDNNAPVVFMAVGPIEVNKLKKSSDILNPENINILSASDLIRLNKKNNFVALIIGPEGGFSIDELLFSYMNKFSFICLGSRILRMETVPIALISILQSSFGDF